MENNVNSILSLDKLVFDKIEFKRLGMKNENKVDFKMKIIVNQKQDDDIYRVTLIGNKEEEYILDIELTGYFSFNENEMLDEELKKKMIRHNAVAIIMPYMRSQISLITAQPEVDCVVLPPFNITKMMSDD